MKRAVRQLWKSESGSVAPIVAISLFALIGAAGIGFDYARMAGMHTELQDAADHAALAAAAQLDGKTNARSRATTAAQSLISNLALFSNDPNDTNGRSVTMGATNAIQFYQDKAKTTLATSDANAYYVLVTVDSKQAFYALTPVVAAFTSGQVAAKAFAGVASGICKVPPVMICNPQETSTVKTFDASGLRFALVVSRFNSFITEKLQDGAVDAIVRHGGKDQDIEVFKVPGTWELPQIAQRVAQAKKFDGIVALGCLVRGGTSHYDLLAAEVTKGLAHVAQHSGVPLAFGVLTCDSLEQAIERAGTKQGNKGFDAAVACIELIRVSSLVSGR